MNTIQLMKAAQKMADYENASVKILRDGLHDTWDNANRDLDADEHERMIELIHTLKSKIDEHGNAIRMAVTIVAFEIQIENAQERQIERNN